jgi:nitrate reductase assembly molybdenum cofactor insertion protein NarJ
VLKEAAVWQLVSLLFECPTYEWIDQVASLACEIADPSLTMAAEAARQEATPELYHSTFGPGGPARPREVSYRRAVLPGATLAELGSLYEAFAYRPSVDEPPDHVAVETGFVAYLYFKQAYALAGGDRAHSDLCADVAHRFIREHLGRIAGPLAGPLTCSGIAYLAGAAEVLRSRTGPPPADASLMVLNEESDGDE